MPRNNTSEKDVVSRVNNFKGWFLIFNLIQNTCHLSNIFLCFLILAQLSEALDRAFR
jgi:hypothetical protein